MHRWIRLAGVVTFAISAQAVGQALPPNDAVTVDPDVHRVILENEYIRVFDARASKGTKSPMHSHPPFVLVSLDSTRFRMTLPDGKTSLSRPQSGPGPLGRGRAAFLGTAGR